MPVMQIREFEMLFGNTTAAGMLQNVILSFERLSGLVVTILLAPGINTGYQLVSDFLLKRLGHRNPFCLQVKNSRPGGCGGYDAKKRMERAGMLKSPFVDECPQGIMEAIIPVIVNNRHIATLYCGPLRLEKRNCRETVLRPVKDPAKRKKIIRAWNDIPYMRKEDLETGAEMLFYALSYISSLAAETILEMKRKNSRYAYIDNALHDIYNSNISIPKLSELAAKAQMTASRYSRAFERYMNKGFSDFVTETKIFRSQKMLQNTSLGITAVALEAGFASHSYYSKKFKKLTGITPLAYRSSALQARKTSEKE
ncbi:MAG: hypothetical protein A2096_02700 [Spirochaetes bacterium GWF1_41_5]|nr:MAG: hypothetical protein A2096_02700 [Spirochaetes bacterium GWF1_41_5]HBE03720.1 hypothetical protein [Spirochaetia bacterium]